MILTYVLLEIFPHLSHYLGTLSINRLKPIGVCFCYVQFVSPHIIFWFTRAGIYGKYERNTKSKSLEYYVNNNRPPPPPPSGKFVQLYTLDYTFIHKNIDVIFGYGKGQSFHLDIKNYEHNTKQVAT